MLWIITDTHIGHKNIIQYCGRPENFGSLVCKNWKNCVAPEDTVIHLGDVAWGDENLQRIARLPGHKILVRGNHDTKSSLGYMEKGFELVTESITMNIDGMSVLFSHKPIFGHTEDINIHGHQHDLHFEDGMRLYLPMSLEHMDYKPVAVDYDFVHTLKKWVGAWKSRGWVPSVWDVIEFCQNGIGEPLERDYFGTKANRELSPLEIALDDENSILIPEEDVYDISRNDNILAVSFRRTPERSDYLKKKSGRALYRIGVGDSKYYIGEYRIREEKKKNDALPADTIFAWMSIYEF